MKAINIIVNQENVEFAIGYEKWLKEAFSEPTEAELNEMMESFKPFTVGNRIIALKPVNNQYYQGA